jgi:hypothetical protein
MEKQEKKRESPREAARGEEDKRKDMLPTTNIKKKHQTTHTHTRTSF